MSDLFYKRLREFEPTAPIDGVYHCKWCGAALTGRGKRYCSNECELQYEIRRNWNLAKWEVEKRDKGVCAVCNVDTGAIARELYRLSSPCRGYFTTVERREAIEAYSKRAAELTLQNYNVPTWFGLPDRLRLYDIDHILPVSEGGGGCGLDNLRTLCHPCHKRVTAELAARRKSK